MYIFPDGDPNDGIPIEEVVTVSLGLTVVYMFLATAGIVFAVACLLFTIIFRKKRYMYMYSHTLRVSVSHVYRMELSTLNLTQVNSSV